MVSITTVLLASHSYTEEWKGEGILFVPSFVRDEPQYNKYKRPRFNLIIYVITPPFVDFSFSLV